MTEATQQDLNINTPGNKYQCLRKTVLYSLCKNKLFNTGGQTMRIIHPEEAKIIYEILLTHEARTLSPGCDDPDNLNLMLDHLRRLNQ